MKNQRGIFWGLAVILGLVLSGSPAEAGCRDQEKKTKLNQDNDPGYPNYTCPSGYFLKSNRSGGKWTAVAGVIDEISKATIQEGEVLLTCERGYSYTTTCDNAKDKCLKDNAVDSDYCTTKNALVVVDPEKSACPDVADAVEKFRQKAGLDLCFYYAKPKKRGSNSSSSDTDSSETAAPVKLKPSKPKAGFGSEPVRGPRARK